MALCTISILKGTDGVPPNIFLVGDPDRVEAVVKYFDYGAEFTAENREFKTAAGHYHGIPMAVMSVGIGTDNTEIAAVELHALWEYNHRTRKWHKPVVKPNIIRIGTCGCPQKDIPVGSLAITYPAAIGLDNTGIYYPFQSKNPAIIALQKAIKSSPLIQIPAYASGFTPKVAKALRKACQSIGLEESEGKGFYIGCTSSASGFYGPQGRKVGRLGEISGKILIPDLQDILGSIRVGRLRVVNNEMEASVMGRIFGEILGYNVGAICAVLANRNTGEFVPREEYTDSVDRAIRAALIAMENLASR